MMPIQQAPILTFILANPVNSPIIGIEGEP